VPEFLEILRFRSSKLSRAIRKKGSSRKKDSDAQRCRPRLEQLEPRATPSTDLFTNMVAEMMEHAPEQAPATPFYLSKMRADGSFSDFNYRGNSDTSASHLQQHGWRLEAMTLAYKWNDPSNALFNDAALKTKILQGWSYIASKGGQVTAPNWWWKAIGVPQGLADGLVLMRSEIPTNTRNQVLSKYFGTVWQPGKMDGANLAYQAPMAMIAGMLRGDTNRIRSVVSSVTGELSSYSGEGIRRDMSFLQHKGGGKYNYYSGSYGIVFAREVSRVMRWVHETPQAFGVAAVDQQLRYLVDGLSWITRGDALDLPAQGRSISRQGWSTNQPFILRNALADMVPLGRRTDELLAGIDRYDNGISDTNFLSGNKSFWVSDAAAHQRPDMLMTIRMLSNRISRPETAAGENRQGFFMGDGFTMLVKDGNEFGEPGGPDVMQVWNWQRLPGTTIEQTGSIPYYDMFKSGTHSAGSSDLVGSVSDGTYGLAAMDYRRSGVSVTARKAWFMFDDEIVALGAGINDSTPQSPVFTTMNQVFLDGQVTVEDASGRRTVALGGTANLNGPGWIEHDKMGYVLLDPTSKATVQAQFQRGANFSLPVFSAWVDHGKGPKNATYAYAVVPDVTADQLDEYSQALPIKVLANTPSVQAVQHQGLGQTQIAFYAAGSVNLGDGVVVSVDRAANVIVRQIGDTLSITASDPRQSASPLTIKITERLEGPGVRLLADGQTSQITFALPGSPFNGSSVTRSFQIIGSPTQTVFSSLWLDSGDATPPANRSSGEAVFAQPPQAAPQKAPSPLAAAKSAAAVWSNFSANVNRLGRGHGGQLDPQQLTALAADAALEALNFM
jgi:chondroitin AC lyase